MLRTLLKKQLLELTAGLRVNHRDGSARDNMSLILYVLLYVYLFGVFAVLFGKVAGTLAEAFCPAGLDWMYFALMGMLSLVLGLFMTAFTTARGLFAAGDNDLLLAMPIPSYLILTARMLGVFLSGLLFSGTVYLPAVAVYFLRTRSGASLLCGLLLWLLQGLTVLALACGLGCIAAAVLSRLRRKNLAALLLALVFLILYFGAYRNIGDILAKLILFGEKAAGAETPWLLPLYVFGRASAGEPLQLLLYALFAVLLFALCLVLLSRSFLRIAAAKRGEKTKGFRYRRKSAGSVSRALLRKELKRFTSSANYMLNCGLGLLLCAAAAVYLLIKPELLPALLAGLETALPGLTGQKAMLTGTLAAGFLLTCDIAAPSVSLEGNNIWILQSMPVEPYRILRAKADLQLVLSLPVAYLALGVMAYLLKMEPTAVLAAALYLFLFIRITADLGVLLNLLLPNLHWTSEISPIKQGLSVLLSLASNLVLAAGFAAGFRCLAAAAGSRTAMAAVLLLSGGLCLILDRWLRTAGCARWRRLA